MTKAITQTYTIAHEYRRQITTALLATCMVFALVYAMNLYRVISHTIALQQVNLQANALDASIQHLDAQYIGISSKITPDNIHSYGFNKGQVSAFISRTASLGSVALVAHEL